MASNRHCCAATPTPDRNTRNSNMCKTDGHTTTRDATRRLPIMIFLICKGKIPMGLISTHSNASHNVDHCAHSQSHGVTYTNADSQDHSGDEAQPPWTRPDALRRFVSGPKTKLQTNAQSHTLSTRLMLIPTQW